MVIDFQNLSWHNQACIFDDSRNLYTLTYDLYIVNFTNIQSKIIASI